MTEDKEFEEELVEDDPEENLERIMKHKTNVLQNCIELARAIRRTEAFNGESERFARQLIQRGYEHDNSKLDGIEWEYLHRGKEFRDLATRQHQETNDHHPEYWPGGMDEMPEICIAEMVCDWKARSNEQGTSVREFVREKAMKRFNISPRGKTYKRIKKYLDLVLEQPF